MASKPAFKLNDLVTWRKKTDLGSEVFSGTVVRIIEPGDPIQDADLVEFDGLDVYRYGVELQRTGDVVVPDPSRLLLQARNDSVKALQPKDGDAISISLSPSGVTTVTLNGQELKRVKSFSFSVSPSQEPILSLELIGYDLSLQGFLANVVGLPQEGSED